MRLEQRVLLAWSGGPDCEFCDVNRDGEITPADVLMVINEINAEGFGPVPATQVTDVNFDGFRSPADVLCIINTINARVPAANLWKVRILDSDSVGFTDLAFAEAIKQGIRWYEQFDVTVEFVDSDPADLTVTTAEIYLGDGLHAAGRFLEPNIIQIHSGLIAAHHHSGNNGPANLPLEFQVFANLEVAEGATAHETRHWVMGPGHSGDPSCIGHSGATAKDFCFAEESILASILGRRK